MSTSSFLERLFQVQRRKPEPEPVPQGVSRKLPDGTVLWADDQESLDKAYEQLKDKHS